ncbi:MAG: transporter substrate-binding domain-containing protein [Puniceicoccales bacterium]|nr:transporter substrate-binding domain-containing protein [Puniceicoccales bacterium]
MANGAAAENSGAPKGIIITENQIAVLRAIADFLFSTGRDTGDLEATNAKKLSEQQGKQEKVIQGVLPAESEKNLKVGVLRGNLPLADMRDGKPVGFEIDWLKLLLEGEAVTLEFTSLDAAGVGKAMEAGTVDVVVGGCVKSQNDLPGRSESYLNADIVAVFEKKFTKNSQKFSFSGKSIGAIDGSSEETFMRNAGVADAKIITFPSNDAMVADLLKESKNPGESIDVFLTNSHVARDMVARYPELKSQSLGEKREVVIQTQKGSPWREALDRRIKESVGSQKFLELKRRWNLE